MSEKQPLIWVDTPTNDGEAPDITLNHNKMSTLLSELAMTHIGLFYAWVTYASLPFDPLIVGGISTILLLVLWSDTTPGDVLSRTNRAATRKFISNCIGVLYLFFFMRYSTGTIPFLTGTATLFGFIVFNIAFSPEFYEYECLMRKLKEHSRRQHSTPTDIEAQSVEPQPGVQIKVPAVEQVEKESS